MTIKPKAKKLAKSIPCMERYIAKAIYCAYLDGAVTLAGAYMYAGTMAHALADYHPENRNYFNSPMYEEFLKIATTGKGE